MRISDWSSDVCSSDLRNSVPMIGRSPSHGVLSAELLPTFFSRPPMTKLCPEPSSTVVSARRVARAGMVKPPKLTETASLRSEEHKSELQSLMRTSYAVFFLKKKKKNKQQKGNKQYNNTQ